MKPNKIDVIGQDLAISWDDGEESFINLEKLRRACPCAVCSGEKDLTGNVYKGVVNYTSQSFVPRKLQPVGGYALQITWSDGHSTGLYPWQMLKKLGKECEPG